MIAFLPVQMAGRCGMVEMAAGVGFWAGESAAVGIFVWVLGAWVASEVGEELVGVHLGE